MHGDLLQVQVARRGGDDSLTGAESGSTRTLPTLSGAVVSVSLVQRVGDSM